MRPASDAGRIVFRSWTGPSVPGTTYTPYVISEPVAKGWRWKILRASLFSTSATIVQVQLFAIPPQFAGAFNNVSVTEIPADGSPLFTPVNPNHDGQPLRGAVLLSCGSGGNPEMSTGSSQGFCSVNVSERRRFDAIGKNFYLPEGWALLGYQQTFGGLGNLVLSAMVLPENVCPCEKPDVAPPKQTFFYPKSYAYLGGP